MCTIGYLPDLGLVFKNRDKSDQTAEEVVRDGSVLATRTVGADYYSCGLNRAGCAFVSAAINSPRWMEHLYRGETAQAAAFLAAENEGLSNPARVVSAGLRACRSAKEILDRLRADQSAWRGYNIIIADGAGAWLAELRGWDMEARPLTGQTAATNHFCKIKYGPTKDDYPSTHRRLAYTQKKLAAAGSLDDVFAMLRPRDPEDVKAIWRTGVFSTISSVVIDFKSPVLHRCAGLDMDYQREDFK